MKRWMLLTLGAGLVALVTSLATPAAAVGEIAYNEKTQYLTAHPREWMSYSCVDRRIFLAAGTYDWGLYLGYMSKVEPHSLREGWYTWSDCLYPHDEWYSHESKLFPDNGWVAAAEASWNFPDTATYSWGSSLRPL